MNAPARRCVGFGVAGLLLALLCGALLATDDVRIQAACARDSRSLCGLGPHLLTDAAGFFLLSSLGLAVGGFGFAWAFATGLPLPRALPLALVGCGMLLAAFLLMALADGLGLLAQHRAVLAPAFFGLLKLGPVLLVLALARGRDA